MFKAVMVTEAPLSADDLRRDMQEAGLEIVAENTDASELAKTVIRITPDIVIAVSLSPSNILIDAARTLGAVSPCPFILFTSDADSAKIDKASDANIHSYVVDGYSKHRLPSVIQVARARFRHEQILREQLSGLSKRFEERKVVDRAKGVLMRSRGVTEDQAFELLRGLAMRSRQRIGVVAQSVIDMSRAGEAVNRAGQLRMLSQRIVKCYAQLVIGLNETEAMESLADCVARVEANLGIIDKAISGQGYGDLVERVRGSWRELFGLCGAKANRASLMLVDTLAENMLTDSENLTAFLESSGLISNLKILNISGRQRMISQRIAKLSFLYAIEKTELYLLQLQEMTTGFQIGLDYLCEVPLSSASIRSNLDMALAEWKHLSQMLRSASLSRTLGAIADSSEKLLAVSERLTDQYEQAMQVLIGGRIGQMI